MKLEGYQSAGNVPTPASAAMQVSGSAQAYGTDGSGMAAIAKGIGDWQKVLQKQAEEDDRRQYLQALDQYNKGQFNILHNEESGLLNTVADNAAGISESYAEQNKKLREDILKNTKFHYKNSKAALEHSLDQYQQRNEQKVYLHQQKQGEAVREATYAGNVQNAVEAARAGWHNAEDVEAAMEDVAHITGITYGGDNGSEVVVKGKLKEAQSQIATSAINEAIVNGDYTLAKGYLEKYGSNFSQAQYTSFSKNITAHERNTWERELGREMFALHGGDLESVRRDLESRNGFNSDKPMSMAEQDRIMNIAASEYNFQERQKRFMADQLFDRVGESLLEMRNSGVAPAEALAWAQKQAGNSLDNLKACESAYNLVYGGSSKAKGTSLSDDQKDVLLDMLRSGEIKNKAELEDLARKNGASQKDLKELAGEYQDYLNGDGIFQYKFGNIADKIIGDRIKGVERAEKKEHAMAYMKWFVRDYRNKHNGESPLQHEVEMACADIFTKQVYGTYISEYGRFWDDTETLRFTPAQLAYAGVQSIKPVSGNMYEVVFMDGRMSGVFDGDMVAGIVNRTKHWNNEED